MDLADKELVRAAQAGDRVAFDRLVELHGPAVLRYLTVLARPPADAEDLAQEALLQAFRGLRTFQEGTDFRAWLLKIAYHSWVHTRRRKQVPVATEGEPLAVPAPAAVANDDELAGALRQALATLPEEQRAVVQLRFGEDLSHAQIAEVLGVEAATVRWRLYRARQSLQTSLKAWAPSTRKKDV